MASEHRTVYDEVASRHCLACHEVPSDDRGPVTMWRVSTARPVTRCRVMTAGLWRGAEWWPRACDEVPSDDRGPVTRCRVMTAGLWRGAEWWPRACDEVPSDDRGPVTRCRVMTEGLWRGGEWSAHDMLVWLNRHQWRCCECIAVVQTLNDF